MRHLFTLPLLSLALAAPAAAQTVPVNLFRDAVRTLSSDEYEGRAPGTAGEEKTLAFLVELFQAAGLKPGNPKEPNGPSWFQDVPMVEITARNVSPLTFTGGTGAPQSLAYGPQMVVGTYRVTPRIEVANSDVVFVGYGINAPERGWNDYAGLDVKGKTVVILVNDPDWSMPGLDGPFGGRAMTYYGRWTYKYEEAARQGAAAALIVHQTEPAAYGWNVVQSSWTGAQQVAATENDGADQSAAIGWVQLDQAKALFARAGQDFDKLAAAARQKGFKPVPLAGVEASVSFDNQVRRHASKNVVGILPGTTAPDEVVLYTAHWDHLGQCEAAPDGDNICNGAIDNATGTAALIAIAKAQAQAGATPRSQVYLAVTGEESGLLGSDYYGKNPLYPHARTVGGVNMDALSMAGPAKNVVVVGYGKSDLDAYLTRALATQGRVASPEPTPEKGFYYRSDHFSLAKHGVPMLYFDGGDDLVDGGKAAGQAYAEAYEENAYHGPKDEFDPNWRWDGIQRDLDLYYSVGRALASTTEWPNWKPGDEFRSLRDKSRAGQ
ncbi:M28 family peptidase [Sphingomonas sp.]|uniref:M28 family peptidase n=1 Tax=Sphingomonas sp. TaxID=28214 RepID=UPI002CBA2D0C|nr:M28 family peptidase [Sphingomonas sp.]HTG37352.1 M28 family peptidase [Sphingomonas sp.]